MFLRIYVENSVGDSFSSQVFFFFSLISLKIIDKYISCWFVDYWSLEIITTHIHIG